LPLPPNLRSNKLMHTVESKKVCLQDFHNSSATAADA
jgi:hypothetical protein